MTSNLPDGFREDELEDRCPECGGLWPSDFASCPNPDCMCDDPTPGPMAFWSECISCGASHNTEQAMCPERSDAAESAAEDRLAVASGPSGEPF